MAGLLASHTHTLPAPCTHHFSALPTLKYSSAFLPAGRSRQLRGEQGAAARSSWPLRAATLEAPTSPPSRTEKLPQTDKYAVVDLGGTQLLVEEGRWYTCNRLQAEPGSKVQLGRVLALKDEGVFTVGQPYLESVVVEAEVLEDTKGPKLLIFKYRAKKHYRKKTGHRQPLTKFLITKIDKQ